MTFEEIIKEKIKRLDGVPLKFQTEFEKQQKVIFSDILEKLSELTVKDGHYEISTYNLNTVASITDELKKAFLTDDYLKAVKEFGGEFDKQAAVNNRLFKSTFGDIKVPAVANAYIKVAQKNAVESLIGAPIDKEFIKPIQSILENAIINGAKYSDTVQSIKDFVEGSPEDNSKLLKYVKQITSDTFAITDRSYTSIVADTLDNDWFYYSGTTVGHTRCFCKERVGNYYHYKEIESWGNGDNLGDCDLGDGTWAGEIDGTNQNTIYSYLGGYNCLHFIIPVSIEVVPEADIKRAENLGYYIAA